MNKMIKKSTSLFVGIIHQKDDKDDFVDVRFITINEKQAQIEMTIAKEYAIKKLKLKCVIERDNYAFFISNKKMKTYEVFYIERLIIK